MGIFCFRDEWHAVGPGHWRENDMHKKAILMELPMMGILFSWGREEIKWQSFPNFTGFIPQIVEGRIRQIPLR
jgi:hypothetical protein